MLIHPSLQALKKIKRINIRFAILLDFFKFVDFVIVGQFTGDAEHALVCIGFTNGVFYFLLNFPLSNLAYLAKVGQFDGLESWDEFFSFMFIFFHFLKTNLVTRQ